MTCSGDALDSRSISTRGMANQLVRVWIYAREWPFARRPCMPTEGGGPGSPATGYRSPRGLDGYHQIGEHAELMTFSDALVGWHDFYVTAGAAAATLAGLLFVGLSLHIRVVVSHPDVRSLARVTLTDFFVILLIALALLQPT